MATSEETRDLAARYLRLYTGAVADILDERGLRHQALPYRLRPLSPGLKVAGPAFTVRGRALHSQPEADPRYKQIEMLEAVFPGSVIVLDPGDESTAAHWGELMSLTAHAAGATGAVVNGGVRDTQQIRDMQFPVFATFHSPLTAVWRWELTEFQVPLRVGCVLVRPGDFVFGDDDGVLVIPADMHLEVLEQAEDIVGREHTVRDELLKGGRIRELFETHRAF